MHYLLDTNILVYCFDQRNNEKRGRALELIERLGAAPKAALPAQVLAEFTSVALCKMTPPIPADRLYRQIELYEQTFPVIPLTSTIVMEAIRGVDGHGLSYYDAQLWATAKLAQIRVVLSEDFSTGSTLEGVTFWNPLADSFDLGSL